MSHKRVHAGIVALLIVAAVLGAWAWQRSAYAPSPPPAFVGSSACVSCHAAEHAAWSASQHALAMQPVTDKSVLGRFDGEAFTVGGVSSTFSHDGGRYLVQTDGADGKPADFEAKYTFGVYPLQQYLLPLPGGRLQALGIAWDARPAASGGQRWFHLYPDAPPEAGGPLHWTGTDQNWNYQCADCHSTNVRKNFDAPAGTFATTWSEISVGCEACHGPASNHLAWARRGKGWRALGEARGLTVTLDERRGAEWRRTDAPTATRSGPRTTSREIDTCARCHSRRGQYSDAIAAGGNWLDAFRPALIEPGLYYADGQQRDEVYTWGSFVQSRMHAAGVTCADCHEPHSGKLRAAGNAVCAHCHAPETFDVPAHHHHAAGSQGAQCTACHMPASTYMVIDPRHDHSLRIPRPDRNAATGAPDACTACHANRDPAWAAAQIHAWYPQPGPGFQTFADAFAAADRGEPAAADALATIIADPAQPSLVRASALARLLRFLDPENLTVVANALRDPDALVRATAADAFSLVPPAERTDRLSPLLSDPVRLVRMAAARSLAGESESRLVGEELSAFASALGEWTAAQEFNADRPEALTNLGTLQTERQNWNAAIAAYRKALALDPTFVQAAVNLADADRALGDEAAAEKVLREALARNPQAPAARHALGLALIRQGRVKEALAELRRAAELEPSQPHFAFVYAVALHDTGDADTSIATLRRAIAAHPYERELVQALAAYQGELKAPR